MNKINMRILYVFLSRVCMYFLVAYTEWPLKQIDISLWKFLQLSKTVALCYIPSDFSEAFPLLLGFM